MLRIRSYERIKVARLAAVVAILLLFLTGSCAPQASSLDVALAVLRKKIDDNNFAEAAPAALEALRLAVKENAANWIRPLSAVVPSLYAQAGDLNKAEMYFHAHMRAVLLGQIAAPNGEVSNHINYMTDAFIQLGHVADAIASLDRFVRSLPLSQEEMSAVGTELFRTQHVRFQNNILYDYAIQSMEKALEYSRLTSASDTPRTAYLLNDLGYAYSAATRWHEAEAPLKESLRIREAIDSKNLREIGTIYQNLAALFLARGELLSAEHFARQAVATRKEALGTEHLKYLESRFTLAHALRVNGKIAEAIEIFEDTRLGYQRARNQLGQASMATYLAFLYEEQGDRQRSIQLSNEVLGLLESASASPEYPLVLLQFLDPKIARALKNGELKSAKDDMSKLLSSVTGRFSSEHVLMIQSLALSAQVDLADNNFAGALESAKHAFVGLETQFNRILSGTAGDDRFVQASGVLPVLFHVASESTARGHEGLTFERTFQAVQWSELGGTNTAIRQMATRAASVHEELANDVRELQDLAARAKALDVRLVELEGGARDRRNEAIVAALRADLQRVRGLLNVKQEKIKQTFPEYALLVRAAPLDSDELKKHLRPTEVLVKFYVPGTRYDENKAFVWAITKEAERWHEIEVSGREIADEVGALRCGLDRAGWVGDGKSKCAKLLNIELAQAPGPDDPLPFDLQRSHRLYQALFGPIADLIQDKHLVIVPSGPLTQLPFHVLIVSGADTQGEKATRWRQANWLARHHAISMLPSISSLHALRQNAKASRAEKPVIGFGNPLLDGQQRHLVYGEYFKEQAKAARENQSCQTVARRNVANMDIRQPRGFESIFRGAHADIDELREWDPLPETADELCEVGAQLGAAPEDIYLGARATEGRLKDLSEQGILKNYATVHFATHGALSGQVKGSAEPGLIMTPPETFTTDPEKLERDDGYLTASEVATLKLDADLVIMAACNTAGSSGESAEALSGMARAFFYAGARALLVSHWEVNSEATVALITRMAKGKAVRAEALRQAMLAMIDQASPEDAHPAHWAPFVLVGEGSR